MCGIQAPWLSTMVITGISFIKHPWAGAKFWGQRVSSGILSLLEMLLPLNTLSFAAKHSVYRRGTFR